MKYIELSNGKRTTVDDDDYEMLKAFKWHMSDKGYVVTSKQVNLMRTTIQMHRLINRTPAGMVTDHINHDKLDNRKINLRTATFSQNMMNSLPTKGRKYKGVSYSKKEKGWASYIHIQTKREYLGLYETEDEAARAYNEKAKELHGEFALLNQVEEGEFKRLDKKTGISSYRGVTKHTATKKWAARISFKKKMIFIGTFDDSEDAAKAYDLKAIELHGDKAKLNFPNEITQVNSI